jgi:predicted transcriptional regulator
MGFETVQELYEYMSKEQEVTYARVWTSITRIRVKNVW